MRILFSYADTATEWNCSEHRALSPANIINKSGKHSAKLLYLQSFMDYASNAVQDIVGACDVIVVQRNIIIPQVWAAMDYWRGLGKTVVVDLDDGYPTLPWSNPAHEFWMLNKAELPEPPIKMMIEGMKHADALTSPSKVILDDWKDIIPGVHIPNFARGEWYKHLPRRVDDGKIVLGWGGSVSHYDSWWFSGILEAIEQVCKERPNVIVKICGNDPRLLERLNVAPEQKQQQQGVVPQEWPKIVASFDIGLAPLDLREGKDAYDQRRSWIKGMEYMLVGIPWIASKSEPYRELWDYGVMVENSVEAWRDALLNVIDNYAEKKKEAKKNLSMAWNLTLEANVDRIIGQYEKAQVLRGRHFNLPNVLYVKGRDVTQTQAGQGIPEGAADAVQEATAQGLANGTIQRASYAAAYAWYVGAGLEYNGVNLAESMTYDVIQRVNQGLRT